MGELLKAVIPGLLTNIGSGALKLGGQVCDVVKAKGCNDAEVLKTAFEKIPELAEHASELAEKIVEADKMNKLQEKATADSIIKAIINDPSLSFEERDAFIEKEHDRRANKEREETTNKTKLIKTVFVGMTGVIAFGCHAGDFCKGALGPAWVEHIKQSHKTKRSKIRTDAVNNVVNTVFERRNRRKNGFIFR